MFEIFFEYPKDNRTRENRKFKLYLKAAKINCYKYSFFVRIVSIKNNFPSEIMESNNVVCNSLRTDLWKVNGYVGQDNFIIYSLFFVDVM